MSRIPWNDLGYTERDVYDVGEDAEQLMAMLEVLEGGGVDGLGSGRVSDGACVVP